MKKLRLVVFGFSMGIAFHIILNNRSTSVDELKSLVHHRVSSELTKTIDGLEVEEHKENPSDTSANKKTANIAIPAAAVKEQGEKSDSAPNNQQVM